MNNQQLVYGGLITAVLLGGAWLAASRSSAGDQDSGVAQAFVEVEAHDWDEIGINNGTVSAMYTIANSGDGPLVLSDGRTSCGCTTAKLTARDSKSPLFGMHQGNTFDVTVAQGESADLEVTFDPLFHGPQGVGPITRQVTLQTNDPAQPEIVLSASANVVRDVSAQNNGGPAVRLAPATHDFGTVIYGDVPKTVFTLANDSDQSLVVTRVTTSCSCTTAEVAETTVAPHSSTSLEVAFNPAIHKDDTDLGELTRTIFIETDHPEFPELTANITATVVKE